MMTQGNGSPVGVNLKKIHEDDCLAEEDKFQYLTQSIAEDRFQSKVIGIQLPTTK